MSQIIKAFTSLFLVLYMMVSALGVIGVCFQVLHAQNFHSAVMDELENSDYARPVLTECFETAEKVGYELEITLYPEHDPYVQIHNASDVARVTGEISMARVRLRYPIQLWFFEIDSSQELYGYAR